MRDFSAVFALLLLVVSSSFAQTKEQAKDDAALCKDERKIAQEFIDAELAGVRLNSEDEPACLTKLKPETMTNDRSVRDADGFSEPTYLLPKGRKVSFTLKKLPNDKQEVDVSYQAKKKGKDEKVTDHFVIKINSGKGRELRGCASLYSELKYFVMREECFQKPE